MSGEVDLYDGHYGRLDTDPQAGVRRETYGEDLGQASWLMADEARQWFDLLQLGSGRVALEVACGSGGVTCELARHTGADCVGIDINAQGIEAAQQRAERAGLSARVSFKVVDASAVLPFAGGAFDAIFCNDSINHLPGRAAVLSEWHRLLRRGGRLLYTDPIVVTGQLTSEEIRSRSSIGFFVFTPVGHNEGLLREAGFTIREVRDVTGAVAVVSKRWRDARAARREALVALEGQQVFDGLQRFLEAVHALASARRLSRYLYLAEKPET